MGRQNASSRRSPWTDFVEFARERHAELDSLMDSWNPMNPEPWRQEAQSKARALGMCALMWNVESEDPKRVIEQAHLLADRARSIYEHLLDPGWPEEITRARQSKETRTQWNTMREWARPLLLQVYGSKCVACGKPDSPSDPLHIDHVIPVSKGGTNDVLNLQPLCRACNLKKGAKA